MGNGRASARAVAPKEAALGRTINKDRSQERGCVSFSVCLLLLYVSVHRV